MTSSGDNKTKKAKKHIRLTSGAIQKTRIQPMTLTRPANTKAAVGVEHGEFIVILSDENAKYDNSSDEKEDVGAGAGVDDEVITL